jgi:hypothetical protein
VRPRVILAALLLVLVGGTAAASGAGRDVPGGNDFQVMMDVIVPDEPPPPPIPRPEPLSLFGSARDVEVDIEGFLAWAALDRTTGERVSSGNATDTSSTESMIKTWIAADYLRRAAEQGLEPSEEGLRDAQLAIRHSHNAAAQRLYVTGGQDAVVERMIDICGLADTHIPGNGSGWWSRTEMSAIDAVRLGECVADGTAAGPEWTDWLLEEMRQVVGTTADADQRPEENFEGGRWGIIDGLSTELVDAGVSIKNGWTRIGRDSSWHVNCLAITDNWVMAVMMRYPVEYSLDYGAERCASVARQLLNRT